MRTALLAWLQIRKENGMFVLRIEDIDRQRSRRNYAETILRDMRWLGLDWDEGPDIGGPFAPYTQSERLERYEAALAGLEQKGWIYPCYCSRADIMAAASAPHGLESEGPRYPGTCRHLSQVERLDKGKSKTPSYRFAMPEDKSISFHDGVAGLQCYSSDSGGDFVVKRSDGMIGYQLAVVLDDAAMEITDVLRGSDLLDSTPRQLMLYEALSLKAPRFAHVPLLYGPDGKRLSKRHGSVTLSSIRNAGVQPERVIGILAYLSGLLDKAEPVKPGELIPHFQLQRIIREPVVVTTDLLMELSSYT